MALTLRFPPARPMQAWLLAGLLLLAQGLGLAHRVAHAPGLAQAGMAGSAVAHVHGPARGPDQAPAQASVLAAAGHEADTAECRLIDQLAHADGLCDAAWAHAGAPQATDLATAVAAATPRAGPASAYLARAPPLA